MYHGGHNFLCRNVGKRLEITTAECILTIRLTMGFRAIAGLAPSDAKYVRAISACAVGIRMVRACVCGVRRRYAEMGEC